VFNLTMGSITERADTSRLLGDLYGAIAPITLLAGDYRHASLWARGADIWFATAGREREEFSPMRQTLARMLTGAFVVVLIVYAAPVMRNWH
jgi:hypothetical protein